MTEDPKDSFSRTFFRQMLLRIGLALAAMALSYAGAAIGRNLEREWGSFLGALVGLAIGIAGVVLVLRRLDASPRESAR